MVVYQNGTKSSTLPNVEKDFIAVLTEQEGKSWTFLQQLATKIAKHNMEGVSHFESHKSMDYIFMHTLHHAPPHSKDYLQIYIIKNAVIFVAKSDDVLTVHTPILEEMLAAGDEVPPDVALSLFFMELTELAFPPLNNVEQEIMLLEEEIMEKKSSTYGDLIKSQRRRLFELKKHHQSIVDLLEDLQENLNGILGGAALQNIAIALGRAQRLYNSVMNLRDYITQLRESLQAEIDIDMNQVMKLFTVITAIFLPLTLIVGWYGMNVRMPEIGWAGIYPAIIAASLLIVIASIAYFKRNKWF